MQKTTKEPGKAAKMLGFLGLGLCALCCTLPIIGIIGGASVLTAVAVYAEKIAVILLIVSAGAFAYWLYKKKQIPPACATDCDCKQAHEKHSTATHP